MNKIDLSGRFAVVTGALDAPVRAQDEGRAVMPGIMEFAPQASRKVAGGFFGSGTAQHSDEPGPFYFDFMPEVRPRSERCVGGGQSLLLLHRPSLAREAVGTRLMAC